MRLKEETVSDAVCVTIETGDHTSRVDARGLGALRKSCSSARDVDGSDGPIRGAPEAVPHKVPVKPEACDHPSWVYLH